MVEKKRKSGVVGQTEQADDGFDWFYELLLARHRAEAEERAERLVLTPQE